MDKKYKIGDKVELKLDEEHLMGCIKSIGKHRVTLESIFELDSGMPRFNCQHFFRNEILSIKLLNNPEKNDDKNNEITQQLPPKLFNLSERDIKKIEKTLKNIHYIYQVDQNYYEAIDDIMSRYTVSITAERAQQGRRASLHLITIATEDNVYIFDINYLGTIFVQLKEVLESNRPRKIFHNSSRIADTLKHNHDINLNGIYDTFVTHVMLSDKPGAISLIDCAKLYIDIPTDFFPSIANINWHQRPLRDTYRHITAKRSILLYILFEHFVHDKMLSNYYLNCEKFSNFYVNMDDHVEAGYQLSKTKSEEASVDINKENLKNIFDIKSIEFHKSLKITSQ